MFQKANIATYCTPGDYLNKAHVTFKVKYCHRIFGWGTLREECRRLFYEVVEKQGVVVT